MKLTLLVLAATAVLLIAYDIFAVLHGGLSTTISWVLYSSAKKWPIISFSFGVLIGHLFAPIKGG